MCSRVKSHRLHAFRRQNGRCCYCGVLMWLQGIDELPVAAAGRKGAMRSCVPPSTRSPALRAAPTGARTSRRPAHTATERAISSGARLIQSPTGGMSPSVSPRASGISGGSSKLASSQTRRPPGQLRVRGAAEPRPCFGKLDRVQGCSAGIALSGLLNTLVWFHSRNCLAGCKTRS